MPLDKKQCHGLYAALTCSGNNYDEDFEDPAVRKAHAAKFIAAHPECGPTANHGTYISEGTLCSRIAGGRRRKGRKGRKTRKNRKGRRGTRRQRGGTLTEAECAQKGVFYAKHGQKSNNLVAKYPECGFLTKPGWKI
jgi:hypothetical protein